MTGTTVISVGGSIVVPDGVDVEFVKRFVSSLRARLERRPEAKLALVIGGGSTARTYQRSAKELASNADGDTLDEIGIAATRLNAHVIRTAFGSLCQDPVFTDPTRVRSIAGRVLVGGGWKPGFSTDNVTVHLAEALGADTLVNLSNIRQIYTADPKIDPDATPLDTVSWDELRRIVGDEWLPGANTPFDPVATRRAAELGMIVIVADGRDLANLEALLDGRAFVGTTIRP
ncbi:MAG: UMP kinase [Spirochaetota bacterium]